MERKIADIFKYKEKKLKVAEITKGCDGCFFVGKCFLSDNAGQCKAVNRTDKKNIIFVEVEQSQKLNLCDILKNCPQGEMFWSPIFGDVKFHDINQKRNFINIVSENGNIWNINADGTISFGTITSPEVMLYPSKDQRDWDKFTQQLKKDKFDPKTLKPFDKVIVRDGYREIWLCSIFSNIIEEAHPYCTASGRYLRCIPYNEDTKHLVGTTEEAPEFYKYWED